MKKEYQDARDYLFSFGMNNPDYNDKILLRNSCLTVLEESAKSLYFSKIEQWAEDRNLIKGATRQAQMLKLTEELGELAGGIAKGKEDVVIDSIGDCVVVLTILAAQSGLKIEDCIAAAYEEIKDRKGKMIDGVFVKEEAAPPVKQCAKCFYVYAHSDECPSCSSKELL